MSKTRKPKPSPRKPPGDGPVKATPNTGMLRTLAAISKLREGDRLVDLGDSVRAIRDLRSGGASNDTQGG